MVSENFVSDPESVNQLYMENHVVVDISDVATGGLVSMPTERCQKHSAEILKMWCKHHNEVLCSICALADHRSCSNILYIPDEVSKIFDDGKLRNVTDSLKRAHGSLSSFSVDTEKKKETLSSEKSKYINMIEEHQKKLISMIKTLGRSAIGKVEARYNDRRRKLEKKISSIGDLEQKISAWLQQTELLAENQAQMFVSMKRGEKLVGQLKEMPVEQKFSEKNLNNFRIDTSTEEYLAGVMSLGSFFEAEISAKMSNDEDPCDILSPCLLADGTILVSDSLNKKLKRFDGNSYTITDYINLPCEAGAMCCVGDSEVAVSLWKGKQIQFVAVGKTMSLTRNFAVKHYCAGIAYAAGEVFVSNEGKNVYVYDLFGTLLRTICRNQLGELMFSCTTHLAYSGNRLYVTDKEKGFVSTDIYGTELFTYTGGQLEHGHGVCSDGKGGIFLSGLDSQNVLHIGANGKSQSVVLTHADGLTRPTSVFFDLVKRKLFVTNYESDTMLVFGLL